MAPWLLVALLRWPQRWPPILSSLCFIMARSRCVVHSAPCLLVPKSHCPYMDSRHVILHEEVVERFSREQLQRASIAAVRLDETQTALEVFR